ncbi:RNA pseudouridine synthase [Leptospira fletcheri]|uniref:RNA pseudouridine synthase n=1 Tax=Leptospira fletcheri TaxID=2484981 RepID=A0A4R9GIX5_9LEPT|nr:RNA pseudouridine synthase [Leptospira fletcheri]TGK13069.1 RNA pseudouridine synthase [Leptospira fletcheri]
MSEKHSGPKSLGYERKKPEKIPVLYRDDFLLVAEKPAGLPVHATLDPNRRNFADELQAQEKLPYLRLVNRLDLDTSGLVLFCIDAERNKEADHILSESEKRYLCIVKGLPAKDSFREECFLKEGKGKVSAVRSGGKKAITEFEVLSRNQNGNISLLSAKLITGRRHQIRFQIAFAGFPILGDHTYDPSGDEFKNKVPSPHRCLLHSYLLKFLPPNAERPLQILSPLPEDFRIYLPFFPGISFPF